MPSRVLLGAVVPRPLLRLLKLPTEGARAQSARVLERAWHVVLGATPRLPRRTQRKELPKKLRWVDVENRQNPEGPEPNRGRDEL